MPERRNPVVRSAAILRKGGAHTKSVSGQRQRQRLQIDDAIDEWVEDHSLDHSLDDGSSSRIATEDKSKHSGNGKTKGPKKGQPKNCPFFFLPGSKIYSRTRS